MTKEQEAIGWTFTGSDMIMSEEAAREEARRAGGTTVAYALYKSHVPNGWKLVPVEPTEYMQDAGLPLMKNVNADPYDCAMVYQAMLNAAPQPPKKEV